MSFEFSSVETSSSCAIPTPGETGTLIVPNIDKPNNKAVSKVSVTALIFLQGCGYMLDIRTYITDDKEDLFERITYEGGKGCVDLYNPVARGKTCMELEPLQEQGKSVCRACWRESARPCSNGNFDHSTKCHTFPTCAVAEIQMNRCYAAKSHLTPSSAGMIVE